MSPIELQYFKACYVGNKSEFQTLGLPQSVDFTFHFPEGSSYYYNTRRESISYSPLCILSLAYELCQFFSEHKKGINYDATHECKKIEKCFELLGVTPGAFKVDYYSMYYLKCSLFEDEDWFDEAERHNLIMAGFKEIDISLFNAAKKCNIELVEKLLQQGADPSIDLYNENAGDDLLNDLRDDISVNLWFYEEYHDICYLKTGLHNDYTRSMLCVLYSMASSARLLRLIKDYRK